MAQQLPPRKRFGNNKPILSRESEPATAHDPHLARAREAFEASTSFLDTNYRKDWDNSLLHFQNRHMQGSKYLTDAYKYRSKQFRPKTRTFVRQNEAAAAASFFSMLDVISIEPEDDKDPLQLASAALRQEIVNFRLSGKGQIPWFQICVGGMQDANVIGVVCSKQFWDYRERKVEKTDPNVLDMETGQPAVIMDSVKVKDQPDIKLYPIENIRFDPAAEWTDVVNSSPYFIALEPVRVGDVKERIASGEWLPVTDNQLISARNAGYDSTRQTRTENKEDDKDPRYTKALSDFDIVWVHENFMRIGGEEFHYYTLSTDARLSEPRPLKEAYLHGIRPFVIGTCVIETHKALPDSPVHLAKGLQKEANEVANTRLDNVKLVLNKRWLVRRGKQVDLQSLTRNAPASVTLVNDIEKDVFPVEFSDVTSSSYQEQSRVDIDLDGMIGSFSAGTVQSNRQMNETVGGMNLIKGSSNAMTQYLIRVFSETWVEKVLSHLDMLEQFYESDIDFLNLMARRANIGKYGISAVTQDLLMQPARLVVNVANSAMDPAIRLQMFMQTIQLYSQVAQNMPPDLSREPIKEYMFNLQGFRDGSRFSVDQEGNPELAAAQQMIQQLQQALESKMTEIQANNEPKLAKIQADATTAAAKIENERFLAEMDAKLQLMLERMDNNTRLLVAESNNESKEVLTRLTNQIDVLKTALSSNTQKEIAEMKGNEQ